MLKTAYEIRSSDWSSDVCSSDLLPIDTSVSQPCFRASAASHSSLRTLLPPKAWPDETSSRLAQTEMPSSADSRFSGWIGEGKKPSETRGNLSCRLSGMAVGILLLRNRNMIATGVRQVLLDWQLVRGVSSTGEAIFSENPSFSMIHAKNLYSMTNAPDFQLGRAACRERVWQYG